MASNWALVVGVNEYNFLQSLKYAKRDAQLMQQFLSESAGFERIFFFSDDSPDVGGQSTRPIRSNLLRVLRQLFDNPFMEAGDNFWFFFSGHGMRHNNRDYLMPCDGDPDDIENTAISINYVNERLRRCGADNVIMILDACRSLGSRAGEGIGREAEEVARQTGVISIFSCSPQEYSYEIEELQQGAFTRALLDGLGVQGKCATVERLNQYLSRRVPELVRQHKNARQTPYIIAEPVNKSHLILAPRYATLADIATLKNDAYGAETEGNFDLAEQLWIRVLAAASGRDMDAVRALQRVGGLKSNASSSFPNANVPPQTPQQQFSQPGVQAKQGQMGGWQEHENNLRRYEQELLKAVQAQYPFDEFVRNGLKSFQQSLRLRDEDVAQIEKPILDKKEVEYQEKLRQQEQAQRQQRQREQEQPQRIQRQREQEIDRVINGNSRSASKSKLNLFLFGKSIQSQNIRLKFVLVLILLCLIVWLVSLLFASS